MFEHWYSLDGNYNTPKVWGLHIDTTQDPNLPATLFEAHGLEVENAYRENRLSNMFTEPVLNNLRHNAHSRLLIQSSLEYTRIGEEPYSSVYAWLRAQQVPMQQVMVLTCSDHLANHAQRVWPDIEFGVLDWWEFAPRWWHEPINPTGSAQQRFTSLNRRPTEWRAALTHRLSMEPKYWDNALHTIGNRSYHVPEDDINCRDFLNRGEGYFNEEIESWWKSWLSFPRREIQLPNSTHFHDTAVYTAARSGAINIVVESYPDQQRHSPTEKTHRCYAVARPHITVGHYNWSQNLHQRGYLTYPWDDEYNNIRDPNERMYAVIDVILRFANYTDQQFDRIINSVSNTVQHNHSNWLHRTNRNTVHSRLPMSLRP